ncbi:MAG: TetR/AcrR family transcriptional regulator [Candidatus Neomarinimicrobiota bacterium]
MWANWYQAINAKPKPIEDKRERIILAAVKVFARRGLERGKIADIATEAGIGKGTVYEYFRSKEEIFGAIIEGFFAEMTMALQPVLSGDQSQVEKITRIIDYSFDFLDEFMQSDQAEDWTIMMEIFAQGMRADGDPQLQEATARAVHHTINQFVPVLEEGISAGSFRDVDPSYFALVLFGALDGLALHFYLQRNHIDLSRLKDAAREIFLGGILKPEAQS